MAKLLKRFHNFVCSHSGCGNPIGGACGSSPIIISSGCGGSGAC